MENSRDVRILNNLTESVFVARNHKEWTNVITLSVITEIAVIVFFLANIPKLVYEIGHAVCYQRNRWNQKISNAWESQKYFLWHACTFPISLCKSRLINLSQIVDEVNFMLLRSDVRLRAEQDLQFERAQLADEKAQFAREQEEVRSLPPPVRRESRVHQWLLSLFRGADSIQVTKAEFDRHNQDIR